MTPYEVGERDGAKTARVNLVMHQRIAAAWAKARLEAIADQEGGSDYARGYLDGYRRTLTAAAQQDVS